MWNNAVSLISFDTLPCHGVGCVHGAEGMSLVKAEWGPLNFFNSGQITQAPGVQALPLATETAKAINSQHFGED